MSMLMRSPYTSLIGLSLSLTSPVDSSRTLYGDRIVLTLGSGVSAVDAPPPLCSTPSRLPAPLPGDIGYDG